MRGVAYRFLHEPSSGSPTDRAVHYSRKTVCGVCHCVLTPCVVFASSIAATGDVFVQTAVSHTTPSTKNRAGFADVEKAIAKYGQKAKEVNFDSVPFDSVPFGSVRFGSGRFDSVRFGSA